MPFQVSDEGILQQKMEEAGLSNVQVTPVVHQLSFRSGKEMWNWVTSGERLMFGSDQMVWSEKIGAAVEAIEQAPFLMDEQKRDIFYHNAARFLRLEDDPMTHKTMHHD